MVLKMYNKNKCNCLEKDIEGFEWDKEKTKPNPCCQDCMKRNGVKENCNVYLRRCPYYKISGLGTREKIRRL